MGIKDMQKKSVPYRASMNEYSLIVKAAHLTDASGYNQLLFVPEQLQEPGPSDHL